MGNSICNEEYNASHKNTYYEQPKKLVILQDILHYDERHQTLEIGLFLSKSTAQNQENCLFEWQQLFDQQQRDRFVKGDLRDLQLALYNLHRTKQRDFLRLVETVGGGKIRWFVWRTLLKCQISEKYQSMKLKDQARKSEIERDVRRTFPNEPYFRLAQQSQDSLSLLLNQISTTFRDLDYTQGMNFIVAFLLMQSGGDLESAWESTFILFYSSKWMLYGIYMKEFPLQRLLSLITFKMLEEREPELYEHMSRVIQLDLFDLMALHKWILTFYLYHLKLQLCLHLWDMILSRGIFALPAINFQLLQLLKNDILQYRLQHEFSEFIQNSDLISPDRSLQLKNSVIQCIPTSSLILSCLNQLLETQRFNEESMQFLGLLNQIENQDSLSKSYSSWIQKKMQ